MSICVKLGGCSAPFADRHYKFGRQRLGLAFTTGKKLRTAISELSCIGTWCTETQSKFERTVRNGKKAGNLSSKFKDTLCILTVYNG